MALPIDDLNTNEGIEPQAQATPLGRRTASGFAWMGLQSVVMRVLNFAGQVILARLLEPKDFGLYNMALSVSGVPSLLSNTGTTEILVRRQSHFRRWANASLWMAICFGLLTCLIHIILAPLAGWYYYQDNEVIGLIILLGFSPLIGSIGAVSSARLQIDMRFRFLAIVAFLVAMGTLVLNIVLARLHFGPYSLMVPLVLMALIRTIAWWVAAPPPIARKLEIKRWRFLWSDRFYLIGSAVFQTLVLQGDNLILGHLRGKEVVGIYAWGYGLSLQAFQLIVLNLSNVLLPSLSQLTGDIPRLRAAFSRRDETGTFDHGTGLLLQFLLAEAGIHILFRPAYYPSIPVAQILSLGMIFQIIIFPSLSLMQAQGRFRTAMITGAGSAAAFLVMVYYGASQVTGMESAVRVSVSVALYFLLFGPLTLRVALAGVGQRWRQVLAILAGPLAAAIPSTGITFALLLWIPKNRFHDWLAIAVAVPMMLLIYGLLVRTWMPASAREGWQLMHELFFKRINYMRKSRSQDVV